jgi:hypothetical protein
MSEIQIQRKKRKKQQFGVFEQVQDEKAVQNAKEVTEALEELEKQGTFIDIQVCPRCKSAKIRRALSQGGDMWAHIGLQPPSYECLECGWQERIVLKATNKRMSVRDIELIRETMDVKDDE